MKQPKLQFSPAEAKADVLRGVPHVLLPYQQRWVADTSPVKIIEKSRRIGLSWGEAADDALYAASREGANVYYMGTTLDMTQQFIRDCAFWAKFYNLAASEIEEFVLQNEDRDIKVFQINFASGHHIQALSSAPRNLRSKGAPGERVVLDEFAFHDDQAELLKAGMAFLMWGGQVRILSTHNGIENLFNVLIEEIRAGKKPYSLHRVTLDDALHDGLFRRICLVRGKTWSAAEEAKWRDELVAFYGDGADEELFCVPARSGGKYFSRVVVEDRMDAAAPVLRLRLDDAFAQKPEYLRLAETLHWCETHLGPLLSRLDPNLKSVVGEDFGRSADLTVILPAQITPQLVRKCPFAVELRNVPFETQRQIVFYLIDRLPRFVAGAFDSRGNGAYLAEVAMQRYGASRIHLVQATPAWYLDNFPRYRSAIDGAAVVLPKDADLLDDHGDVELVGGVPKVPDGKRRKGADGQPRHADGAIAGVMMWHASLHQGAPIEFQSDGPRDSEAVLSGYADDGVPDASATAGRLDLDRGFGVVRGTTKTAGYL